ncbi:MAG: hypothetical protein COT71_00340 [Candidatus Andersenbacteria bacterium CG10_big_fil_rev_8_21_14_0_10_54_11]|uniref:Uncharacterized protein n=1 Tax=Candidatus Andersenbacteria bacterium CG10_big_fil_rev_8_21_14_0_10_54_11 TaxID=1974485 RepID=A0A2M6X095_9BACT|nr:MAG: hypothetical protein COT71_00340 [Candidatus Andersenbacteria bacterium CG10_big_fil_rev_8_21_14_0_10_54_11]
MTTKKTASAIGAAILAAGMLLSPALASAKDSVTDTNQNTGANSNNRNRIRINRQVRERRINRATVLNTAVVTADTGNNQANKNTDGGDQTSGGVAFNGTVHNDLNANMVDPIDPHMPEVDIDTINNHTGSNSTNSNRINISSRFSSRTSNIADVGNTVIVNGDTGGNKANENTKGGNQTSGNVGVTLHLNNFIN